LQEKNNKPKLNQYEIIQQLL